MKCEKCGSTNVVDGRLSRNTTGVFFSIEKVKTQGVLGIYPQISALGCLDCGHIFDLKMMNNKILEIENSSKKTAI